MATVTPPSIDALPAAPDPDNRSTFNTLAYPWSSALPTFSTQVSALGANVKANADDAKVNADIAVAQVPLATEQVALATVQADLATAAAASAGSIAWVSGTTYGVGDLRYSPIDFQNYRRKTAGAGTTDPSLDATNWVVAVSSNVKFTQNSQSADYTFVLGDAGKMIFHPAADTVTRTWTIPANASAAFPVGTVVLCKIEHGAGSVRLTIDSDTLIDPTGVTGSRWLSAGITYWLIKETATKWGITRGVDTDYGSPVQIAIAHGTSPLVSAYPWSASGFGTKFANPGTLPAGNGNSVAFSPAGTEIAIAHTTTPFVSAYPWSASGFGKKLTNPGTMPASTGYGGS
jgi:hypothetical protein